VSVIADAAAPVAVRPRRRVSFRAVFGLSVLLVMGASAVLAPQLAPWDPAKQMLMKRLRPPMWQERGLREHPLGTDHLGRDILSRLLYGGRISLGVGLTAVTLSALLGVTLGLLAGFFGGRADALIMRIVDVFLAIPYILLVMGVVFALGPSLLTVILVMGATRWCTSRGWCVPTCSRSASASSWRARAPVATARCGSCCATCSRTRSPRSS